MDKAVRLTEDCVKATMEKAFSEFEKAGKQYKKGLSTKEQYHMDMSGIYYDGFYRFLGEKGIVWNIQAENYQQFAKEYQSFISGGEIKEESDTPWLFYEQEKMARKLYWKIGYSFCI